MDAPRGESVTAAFIEFHRQGLIYRDVRLTNWCCALRSGISDIEVDYLDIEKRTKLSVPGHPKERTYAFGVIWSFAYKLEGSDEEIVVATTRPETMLGDAAVAVHPDDPRYKQFHGCYLVHPFVERRVKLITDATLVDMSFGTGAVKVTPAHDPNDFLAAAATGSRGDDLHRGRQDGGQLRRVLGDDALRRAHRGAHAPQGARPLPRRGAEQDAARQVLAHRRHHRADAQAAVVGRLQRDGKACCRRRPPRRPADLPRRAQEDVVRLAREHPRLVRLAPALVGPPRPGVLREGERRRQAARRRRVGRGGGRDRGGGAQVRVRRVGLQDEDVLDTWFSSGLFPFSTLGWPDEKAPTCRRGTRRRCSRRGTTSYSSGWRGW